MYTPKMSLLPGLFTEVRPASRQIEIYHEHHNVGSDGVENLARHKGRTKSQHNANGQEMITPQLSCEMMKERITTRSDREDDERNQMTRFKRENEKQNDQNTSDCGDKE